MPPKKSEELNTIEEQIEALRKTINVLADYYNFCDSERLKLKKHIQKNGESALIKIEKEENIKKINLVTIEINQKKFQLDSLEKIKKNLAGEDLPKSFLTEIFNILKK